MGHFRKLLSAKTPFAKLTHILPLRLKLTNAVIRAHFCCPRFPQAVLIVMNKSYMPNVNTALGGRGVGRRENTSFARAIALVFQEF